MEAIATNIRQTIALYWEADRTAVKTRYDAIFPPPTNEPSEVANAENADTSVSKPAKAPARSDAEINGWFQEMIAGYELSGAIREQFQQIWENIDSSYKPVALHHLCAVSLEAWSLNYAFEGLVNDFGVSLATQLLHSLFPDRIFPLNNADPTYRRLKSIFRILGIEYDDAESLLLWEVARNIGDAVQKFNKKHNWQAWQTWAMVYDLGPRLLPDPEPYPTETSLRVWVVAANEVGGDFDTCDRHLNSEVYDWCINSKARRGDIALMYHLAPRSAFVSVYRCFSDAYDDRLRGPDIWTGGSVELTDRIAIPWIALKEMKDDPVLKTWGLLRRNFVGMLQSEVPADVWNRIKELIAIKDAEVGKFLEQYVAAAGGVHSIPAIGEDISEKEVEDTLILPLLQALGWDVSTNLSRQHEMDIKIGSGRPKRVRADFVGFRDALGSDALMVLETKYRIRTDAELLSAVEQCESYAGKLRCPRFAVAAPEGLWIYRMNFPGYSELVTQVPLQGEVSPMIMQKVTPLLAYNTLKTSNT